MSRTTIHRRLALGALAAVTALGLTAGAGAAANSPGARVAYDIPDVSPKPYQRVGDVDPFADFGNTADLAPTGAHYCQDEGHQGSGMPIAGRSWMLAQDYTTDAESLHKNLAIVTVTGWKDGQSAFAKLTKDTLKCRWLDPQTRLTWGAKNPQRYWLSTAGKVFTQYEANGAVRVGDLIVSVTARSTNAATARQMATRMTVAVERNVRATDLVRAN